MVLSVSPPPRLWPKLAAPLVAAVAGIVIAEALPGWAAGWCLALALALLGFGWLGSRLALAAVFVAGFGLVHELQHLAWTRAPLAQALEEGRQVLVEVEGLVADEPLEREGNLRFPLRVRQLQTREQAWRWDGLLWVNAKATPGQPRLQCGDLVQARGSLARPEPPRNPGEFDFATHLRRLGAGGTLRVRQWTVVQESAGFAGLAAARRARAWLEQVLTWDVEDDPEVAAVIKAMVLGVREEMGEEVHDAFVKSGTLHIFSVSGLHVALVAAIIWRVLNILGLQKRWAAWVSLPLVFGYAVLTGWQPAAVRSAFMAGVVLTGVGINRPVSFANMWCLVALLVLALDTQQLFAPGAQLSFVVIATLVTGGGALFRRVKPWCEPDPFLPRELWTPAQRVMTGARRWVAGMMCTSLAALLGSLPLTLWHFQSVSFAGLVANLVHVPLAGMVLGTAAGSLLVAAWWPGLALVLNNANWAFAKLILMTAGWFASWPGGHFFWNPRQLWWPEGGRLTVFDAGEGGAVLLRTPRGRVWLFDTGSEWFFRRTTRAGMRFYGVERLDGLVLTHGDAQHVGGATECGALYHPPQVLHPPGVSRSRALREAMALAGPQARAVSAGEEWWLDEETRLLVLWPTPHTRGPLADDAGLVLRLDLPGGAVLVLGDAGYTTLHALRRHPEALAGVRLVVTGRHAEDEVFEAGFWAQVAPEAVILSAEAPAPGSTWEITGRPLLEAHSRHVFPQWETGAVEVLCRPEGWSFRPMKSLPDTPPL